MLILFSLPSISNAFQLLPSIIFWYLLVFLLVYQNETALPYCAMRGRFHPGSTQIFDVFFVNHPIEFVSLTTPFQVFYPDIFLMSPSKSGIMSRYIHPNLYTLVHTILLTLIFHFLEQTTL